MRVSSDTPEWGITLNNAALIVNLASLGPVWCMEGWFNFSRATAVWGLMNLYNNTLAKNAVTLGTNGGGALQLLNYIQAPIAQSYQPLIGAWIHLAVTCADGVCTLYHDGRAVFSVRPTNVNFTNLILAVGRVIDGDGFDWQGFVSFSNIRISNVIRYAGTFSPQFPLTSDAATQVLLRGNPVNATSAGSGSVTYSPMPALGSYIP